MQTQTQTPEFVKAIFQQLGGGRFIAMTGAKHFVYDNEKKSLTFQLPNTRNKAKAKYCTIALNWMDTYDLKFQAAANPHTYEVPKVVYEISGIYDDQLQEIFTEVTGLYTHL